MADEKKTSRLSVIKDVVGIVIPILGLATIVLSYYQYFYDILKQPSLVVNSTLTRIDSTPAYHVIKMSFEIENQMNAKVEVLSNRCDLYGMWGFAFFQNDSTFRSTVQQALGKVDSFGIWETNRNYIYGGEPVSFLQLFPNHFWLMPKEKQRLELVTVVPKMSPQFLISYQRVRLIARFIFGTKASNIIVRDSIDKDGNVSSRLYLKDGKKQRELSFEKHDDSLFLDKHCIASTITYADVWLNPRGYELPTQEEYQAYLAKLKALLAGYRQGSSAALSQREVPATQYQQEHKSESSEQISPPVKAYNLTGTWVNHSNNARWELTQNGNTISFQVFKSKGTRKGEGSGTIYDGYVNVTYNDFTFDVYKGSLNISDDGRMLEGTLTSKSGLSVNYVLDKK